MSSPRVSSPRLAPATAAALIRASFAAVATDGLRHLGSGWEFDAFLTPDGWVFRFPRSTDYADRLDAERRLHALVAEALPPRVAVPRVELAARLSATFPCRFAGHRYLPGVAADAVAPPLAPVTARTIGEALGALHAVPEAAARAAGADAMDPDDPGARQWLEHGLAAAAALRGIDAVVDRALEWLGQQRLPPEAFPGPLRLLHNDLSPEHLLVDPPTGALVGILDWSDAILGDPARDFAPLAASCGWAFAEAVLRGYPARVDRAFRERVSFMARLLSVIWLATASEHAADFEKHLRWVRNAFDTSAP